MRERLIKFLESENLSSAKFADDIGVQRSSISHILSGRNNPSFEFIQKILSRYKYLNAEWLIMGTGNMIKTVVQGSLFDDIPVVGSVKPDNETITTNESAPAQQISQNAANISPNGTNEKEIFSSAELKESPESSDKILSSPEALKIDIKEKQIEKVMIMYTDKTFTIYSPSN